MCRLLDEAADPAGVVGVDAAEGRRLGPRHSDAGHRCPCSAVNMEADHLLRVHPVDVVSAENHNVVGVFVVDQVRGLVDGVGGTGIPAWAEPLLCRHRSDVLTGQAAQSPVLRDMTVKRMRLVLGKNADPQIAGVDQIRQHEIDKPVGAAEGNRGFGPVRGQRVQPLALPTGQDDAQHLWRFPHSSNLSATPGSDGLSIKVFGGVRLRIAAVLHRQTTPGDIDRPARSGGSSPTEVRLPGSFSGRWRPASSPTQVRLPGHSSGR